MAYNSIKMNLSIYINQCNLQSIIFYVKPVQQQQFQTDIGMQDISLQEKQTFLRINILDAGYDAQEFMEYCSRDHNLQQLQSWSLQMLKQIISGFIQQQKQKKQNKAVSEAIEEDEDEFGEYTTVHHPTQQEQHHPHPHHPHPHPAPIHTNTQQIHKTPSAPNYHPKTQETPITQHHPPTFTDVDWNMFLGSTTVSKPIYPNLKETPVIVPVPAPIQIKLWDIAKQGPLSPPTMSFKEQQKQLERQQRIEEIKENNNDKVDATNTEENTKIQKKASSALITKLAPINLCTVSIPTLMQTNRKPLPPITSVSVPTTSTQARSFLQSPSTFYHINYMPSNTTVLRKFNDCRRLRAVLQKIAPHIRLPYLQPEGWLGSGEGKEGQSDKWKWMVEQFVKGLLDREQIRGISLVRGFIGIEGKQDMKKLLEKYDNLTRPKVIGELTLPTNKITFEPTLPADKLLNNTTSLLSELDALYSQLAKQSQTLFANYDLLLKNLNQIKGTFQSMENAIKKYNWENDEGKEVRVFEGLREMVGRMQKQVDGQSSLFKGKIKGLFRYERENMTTLKEVADSYTRIHSEYQRQSNPTLTSASISSSGQLQVTSAIPLDEPVRNNKQTLCLQQIFWSSAVRKQIGKYWDHLRKRINEIITCIAYDQLDRQNEKLNFWNIMIKKCVM